MSSKTASARHGHDRASLYDEITTKIIAEVEEGRVPWVQPGGRRQRRRRSRCRRTPPLDGSIRASTVRIGGTMMNSQVCW
jgi:antirestriction protein ArdC